MINETNWDGLLYDDNMNYPASNCITSSWKLCLPTSQESREICQNIIHLIRKHNTAFRAAQKKKNLVNMMNTQSTRNKVNSVVKMMRNFYKYRILRK